MIKLGIGLITGIVLMRLLSLGPLAPELANGQVEKQGWATIEDVIAETFFTSLNGPLEAAGARITDADTATFYGKLVDEYRLDEIPDGRSDSEEVNLGDLVPDISRINAVALTMPLVEAGKQIHDKEIALFYYDFLQRAGWDITPPEQEATR